MVEDFFSRGCCNKIKKVKEVSREYIIDSITWVSSIVIDDEMIYEITQNNIGDFQRFIKNVVKVIN